MGSRPSHMIVALMTAVAVVAAELGQVGCHSACYAAMLGASSPCLMSCCSHGTAAAPRCCSPRPPVSSDCGSDGSHCPICLAPTRAITSSRTVLHVPLTVDFFIPTLADAVASLSMERLDRQLNAIVAAAHPPLRELYCIWRN
ncbi:MAG: hypothetical protein JSS49_01120 [Planctomycetes bacterium]|nr:hypothetical protein [Planctomycetota bacterium]